MKFNLFPLLILLVLAFSPHYILAQDVSITCPGGFTKQGEACVPNNPWGTQGLAGAEDAQQAGAQVIDYALSITGGLAVLFIIIGGYWYITSGASPGNEKKGKETLKYAVLGLVVVLLSYAIVRVVEQLANSPGS